MVSSSVFDELLGIPYPACIFLKFGWVGGGVNIGAASGERLGKTTPDRCHLYNPTQIIMIRSHGHWILTHMWIWITDIDAIFYPVLKM